MKPFPVDFFPEPARSFVIEGADALDSDTSYIALPQLAAVGGAVGNSRAILLKRTWREYPVFWVMPIGNSGTLKTPGQSLALEWIRRRQKRLLKMHAKAVAAYKEAIAEWKAKPKEDRGEEPQPPAPCEHVLVGDVTVEGLADRHHDNQRGLLLAVDEGSGWLARFDKYSNGGGDVQHYLSMFSCVLLKIDRKTGDRKTIYVPFPAVSVCGGIQPKILQRAITEEYENNGLLARLLMAMPDPRPARWSDGEISEETYAAMDRLYENLFQLKGESDVDGDVRPTDVKLTDSARDRFIEFVNSHADRAAELQDVDAAAWSKLKGYAARFALIHHLIRQAAGEDVDAFACDIKSINAGIGLAEWFWEETQRIYRFFGEPEDVRQRRELLDLIYRLGSKVTPRQLKEHCRRFGTSEQAEIALNELVNEAMGVWEVVRPSGPKGGRPSTVFVLADSPDYPTRSAFRVPVSQDSNQNSRFVEPERVGSMVDDEWVAGFVAEVEGAS